MTLVIGGRTVTTDGTALRLVTVGSSYTQMSSGWSANKITNGLRGRIPWLNYRNNQQFEYDVWRCWDASANAWKLLGCNQGFGGQLSSQILARAPYILALKPDVLDLQIGDNDHATLTAAATMANVRALCQQALDSGVRLIRLYGSLPRLTTGNGWPAGNVARKRRNACNRMKRAYASSTRGVVYVNPDQTMLNLASADGAGITSLYYDGVHQVATGGLALCKAAEAAGGLTTAGVQRVIANDDVYDAVENPHGNLFNNGILAGATGASSGTGQYPTGCQNNSAGTGLTQTLTTLPSGELELVITTDGTGSATSTAYGGFVAVIPGTFVKDLAFRMFSPVTYLVGPAVLAARGQIRAAGTVDGAAKVYYAYDMENYVDGSLHNTVYWPCQTESMPGTLRTPSLISESDDTTLRVGIQVYVNPAVKGTTTIRLRGMFLGQVDLPWVRFGVPHDLGLSVAPATETQI